MEYLIIYHGNLPSNGSKDDKGKIREILNDQIKKIWDTDQYKNLMKSRQSNKKVKDMYVSVADINYLPMISSKIKLYCHIKIEYFSNRSPSEIFTDGDLDNKLKTLFDGLRAITSKQEKTYEKENQLYYTVLEDDNLVKGLTIETHQIFSNDEDFYIITIIPKKEFITYENIEI